jgi:hypothetical protein
MDNIENYRKRFFNLMESTIGDVKPLISEQDPPFDVRKVNQSDYMPKSDYLGPQGQFQQNYAKETTKSNLDTQSKNIIEFNELKKKYNKILPVEEYYTTNNPYFRGWVESRIKSLNPIEHAKKFVSYVKDFFKQYFDYNTNPDIINKISEISKKNGGYFSDEQIKRTIDSLLNSYFNKLNFVLDFDFNEKNRAIMYVRPYDLDGKIYICALSSSIFGGFKLGDDATWKESILHEVGHLVDGYFSRNDIKFYSSDGGKNSTSKVAAYPHKSMSKSFLDFNKIIDVNTYSVYQEDKAEQFTRFKVLNDMLSKGGLKVTSNLKDFLEVFRKLIDDKTIQFGFWNTKYACNTTQTFGGTIIIDKDCETLDSIKSKYDYLDIFINNTSSPSLYFLFGNYTTINILEPKSGVELPTVEYSINLNEMYNDWKNEYVMNVPDKQSQDTIPDFPTA